MLPLQKVKVLKTFSSIDSIILYLHYNNSIIIVVINAVSFLLGKTFENEVNTFGLPAIISRVTELFENYNFEGMFT